MKFLHIADLHVGKRVCEYPMLEDQRHILTEIGDIAVRERPDAILAAGDVYDRPVPPQEAVTLLVRFTGGEEDALSHERGTPFSDLTEWAAPYIGYAFEAGLTDGVSETLFGSADMVTPAQYLTFMLRALGYESGSDYVWSDPFDFAEKLGLPADEYRESGVFTRGDAVLVSFAALSAVMNEERISLAEWLLLRGAVTENALRSVGLLSASDHEALTPSELYRLCSPAVFSIAPREITWVLR